MSALDPDQPSRGPADDAREPAAPDGGVWLRLLASLVAIGLGVAALVIAILVVRGVLV
jgi:hypothetical protein